MRDGSYPFPYKRQRCSSMCGRKITLTMLQEPGNFCGNLITDLSKHSEPFFFATLRLAWIGEAPMDLAASVGKEWACLLRLVAHRHHQIHWRGAGKGLNAFGTLVADINANFLHRLDSERMHHSRLCARAEDFVGGTPSYAQQSLGHL